MTDVAGLLVGHFTDARRPTGCTVVIAPAGAVAGVDVRGAAPGTRETDLLSPLNAVDRVHAVLLAGGSAFGLDAASGVMRWLEERDIGFAVNIERAAVFGEGGDADHKQTIRVPIVPAAILFDLWVGDSSVRPDADAGFAACMAASIDAVAEGNVGAGAGATVGKLFGPGRAMKGGLGSASITVNGVTVAALVAVNAMGDVIDPATGGVVAGVRSLDGCTLADARGSMRRGEWPPSTPIGAATTLAIVATDAVIDKPAANKIAQMAHDGLARSIDPVHTISDGDVVFALGTGASGVAASTTWLGAMAADVLAEAVLRAVRAARRIGGPSEPHLPDIPSANDL